MSTRHKAQGAGRRVKQPRCSRGDALFLAQHVLAQRKKARAQKHWLIENAETCRLGDGLVSRLEEDLRACLIAALEYLLMERRPKVIAATLGDVRHLVRAHREAQAVVKQRLAARAPEPKEGA